MDAANDNRSGYASDLDLDDADSFQQEALRAEIIARIKRAFSDVRREDGVTLHEAIVMDGFGSKEDQMRARVSDRECDWQDVPDEDIESNHAILYFLDRKGFRYYIPAFMCWTLKNYRTSNSRSADDTIRSLHTGSVGLELRTRHVDRFKNFTVWERYAICDFLRYMATYAVGWIPQKQIIEGLKFWEAFSRMADQHTETA